MLDLQELLFARGLPKPKDKKDRPTKILRHQDSRWDLERLLATPSHFEFYQAHQEEPLLDCKFVVSCIGQRHSHARLLGVYEVLGRESSSLSPSVRPAGFPYPEMALGEYRYDLKRLSGFEDLERRVVIDWGGAALAWHQWLVPKEVVEVLPKNYVMEFPGYEEFIVSFDELKKIVENHSAHREWHRMLGAVAGVYLITDTSTGGQYVGSAYGQQGILGRWTAYAQSGHGGNKLLQELTSKDPSYAKNFSFTILKTVPRTLAKDEVLELERLYKRKLGSRVFGLNAN